MGGVGSGSKPKIYPAELVARVTYLYRAGMTQEEVGKELGLSQKVIWKLMVRHGISARAAAKRDQWGPMNHLWKGSQAKYAALHLRVQSIRGTPCKCEDCGIEGESSLFQWASLTKTYDDVNDYKRLCRSCHSKMDRTVRNLGHYAKRKEVSR